MKELFEKFYVSLLRGNEIEFRYKNKQYYILPCFGPDKAVVGVRMSESYSKNERVFFSQKELYLANIDGEKFGDVFLKMEIVWQNFDYCKYDL